MERFCRLKRKPLRARPGKGFVRRGIFNRKEPPCARHDSRRAARLQHPRSGGGLRASSEKFGGLRGVPDICGTAGRGWWVQMRLGGGTKGGGIFGFVVSCGRQFNFERGDVLLETSLDQEPDVWDYAIDELLSGGKRIAAETGIMCRIHGRKVVVL